MTLWIVAAVAFAVLLSGIAFLALRREEKPASRSSFEGPRHNHPWDRKMDPPSEGRPASTVPPAGGIPFSSMYSEEISLTTESQELYLEDDEPTGPVPRILISAAGGTDPGRKREHNEDAFLLLRDHEVYAIADGMGGYAAGEVASAIAVDTMREAFESGDLGEIEEGYPRRGAEMISVIRRSNARIRAEAHHDTSKEGMGTTIVSARFSPGKRRVYVAHVGDSRCYRIRDGYIKQLTIDHTLGAVGIQGPSSAKLSRAIGVFDDLDVDLTIDEPQPRDFYLLCSDGLFKMLSDEEIASIVIEHHRIEDAVDRLIVRANENGGRDNISLVLVRIDEPDFDPIESGEHRLPG